MYAYTYNQKNIFKNPNSNQENSHRGWIKETVFVMQ